MNEVKHLVGIWATSVLVGLVIALNLDDKPNEGTAGAVFILATLVTFIIWGLVL